MLRRLFFQRPEAFKVTFECINRKLRHRDSMRHAEELDLRMELTGNVDVEGLRLPVVRGPQFFQDAHNRPQG